MRRGEAAFGSAVFLAAAPGVVAGFVPWLLTGWRSSGPPASIAGLGAALVAVGAGVVLHAFAAFVVEGRGTPAPLAPTERLVVGGRRPRLVASPARMVAAAAPTLSAGENRQLTPASREVEERSDTPGAKRHSW